MERRAFPPVQSGETPDSPHPKLVVASGIARQVDHKIMMPARILSVQASQRQI
jgi:hypothetical protein